MRLLTEGCLQSVCINANYTDAPGVKDCTSTLPADVASTALMRAWRPFPLMNAKQIGPNKLACLLTAAQSGKLINDEIE